MKTSGFSCLGFFCVIMALVISAPIACYSQSEMPEMPPPPSMPAASGEALPITHTYDKPSNEMDFSVKPQGPANFEEMPPPPVPPSAASTLEPTASSPGDSMDQFFSTGTVMPPEEKPQPVTTTTEAAPLSAPVTPKKPTRRWVVPNYKLEKKKNIAFRSVRLPEPIYRADYDRDNRHLPVALYESSLQEYLALAVARGNLDQMRALFMRGASIHALTPSGETYLTLAARMQKTDALRWLLQQGANADAVDTQGMTALHYAAQANNGVMTNLLLRYGANPNATDRSGHTPLSYAAARGATNTASMLRSFGANG